MNVVCGCGDDLSTLEGSKAAQSSSKPATTDDNERNNDTFWRNFGFKFTGSFDDTEIVTIHPANKADPTRPGERGTETLRYSKDTFNPMKTFSIIYRRLLSSQGYETFDIEILDDEAYFVLLKGFYQLREEAQDRRQKVQNHPKLSFVVHN